MIFKTKLFLYKKYIFFVAIIILALIVQNYYKSTKNIPNVKGRGTMSDIDLSKYNGVEYKELYLAVTGAVFDVSKGKMHYEKGSAYHYFIGKDATRSLITGQFQDFSNNKDHILDLKCEDLFSIVQWKKTFRDKYVYVGLLEGRYYNRDGTETQYTKEFKSKLKDCKIEKEKSKQQDLLFPPCNVAWSEAEGSRVWCSKSSGGVSREWVGYPRQLFAPGNSKPKCVCVKQDGENINMLKEYDKCLPNSSECVVHVT